MRKVMPSSQTEKTKLMVSFIVFGQTKSYDVFLADSVRTGATAGCSAQLSKSKPSYKPYFSTKEGDPDRTRGSRDLSTKAPRC